jgi:hypothetical protein
MKRLLLFVVVVLLSFGYSKSQTSFCNDPNTVKVKIQIRPDSLAAIQTYWEIVSSTGDTLKKGTSNSDSICVPKNQCIKFTIHDRGLNGLCCANGSNGFYRLYYDEILVRGAYKFKASETTNMGCLGCTSDSSKTRLRIYINGDKYPEETSWSLTNSNNDTLAKGKDFGDTVCVPKNACIKFTILDRYNDGLCCNHGLGNYAIYADTGLLYKGSNFGSKAEHLFGCPPGFDCGSAIPVNINDTLTTTYDDHWYKFKADSTGSYLLSTCDLGNNCQTKLWIYDYCAGLVPTENNAGTFAYSAVGCGMHAKLPVVLIKNSTYYFRIGDNANNCSTGIKWTFSYKGPVVGCMDPASCTYNPIATVNNPALCLYSPDTNCPDQPDLMVDNQMLRTSFVFDSLTNNDQCFVQEGCMKGYGKRYLVKFSTKIENIGEADYYIGRPPTDRTRQYESWIWDPCHVHWHYKGYAEYVLFDKNSNPIPAGFKAGFCVMDINCTVGGGTPKYNCGRQGVSAGCGDIYSSSLKCQWVDITDVDTGRYTLVVRVNWDNSPDTLGRIEANKYNNWGQLCMQISKNSTGRRFVKLLPNCVNYVDCNGEVFGSAKRDCEGICQGLALKGDLNGDTVVNNIDLNKLIQSVRDSSLALNPCRDLWIDQEVNAADVQVLRQCLIERADTNLIQKPACEFKNAIINNTKSATIGIDSVNLSLGYVDLSIQNPNDEIIAFQLRLAGLSIDSVKAIGLGDSGIVALNFHPKGLIFGNLFKNRIGRNSISTPFLRVYFDSTFGTKVCISKIHVLMNQGSELINKVAGPCKNIGIVTYVEQGKGKSGIRLIPNPFSSQTKLYFPNEEKSAYSLNVRDLNGRLLRQQTGILSSEFVFERSDLSPGIYFFQLMGKQNFTGRMVVE